MGLAFNHSSAHWGYSGFNNFRRKLASQVGFNLDEMEGFGGEVDWDTVTDDIKDFLDHSDCDGSLTPEQCEVIYPRLLELVESWDDNDRDKQNAIILADDMKYCVENNLTLEFI
ncbi:hypothetical protein BCAH820_4398 [Bacillus cereus AH820]|uniref:Uncharacterized protein n=1 Tax=Bacillus cereus (strain AH820) TaxID=405535 RepID=B7JP08_BACC0|nr:hypothetical protein [Bacillus cereus]ACK88851.1 hypothetical protein BCAH820_4398 [Bacillus cereus AH820]